MLAVYSENYPEIHKYNVWLNAECLGIKVSGTRNNYCDLKCFNVRVYLEIRMIDFNYSKRNYREKWLKNVENIPDNGNYCMNF
jgi:hypothetical protein